MKAMVVNKWGERSVLQDVPVPDPAPGEALMRVHAAGVGLTLLNMRTGRSGGSTPRIMGHELGGDIVAVGEHVTNVKIGDRCTVYFYLTCGHCRWCRGGRETLCENLFGHVGVHRDGGFAEYVALPAENFLPIPDGLDYEAAAIAADAVNTNWHCMKLRARVTPHDTVLIIGAGGGVGIHGVQMARLFGARVIAADVSDEKLELARQWGAEDVINVRSTPDVVAEAKRLTDGRGVDVAVDYAGNGLSFQNAIAALGKGGRAVIIGAAGGDTTFTARDLIQGEQEVMGSRHSTRREFIETMELMARGLITPVVGMRTHFTEVESIFDEILAERLLGRGAVTYD